MDMRLFLSLTLLLLFHGSAMALEREQDGCDDSNIWPSDYVIGEGDQPHRLRVCYNWGCTDMDELLLNREDMDFLDRLFLNPDCGAGSLGLELQMIRIAIQYLEIRAGEQTPIGNDLGGNHQDRHINGAADCVDNANNSHNYLQFLFELGYLKHWRPPVETPIAQTCAFCPLPQHYTAIISPVEHEAVRYVVDSWLLDNGSLPLVGPVGPWQNQWVYEERHRLNPYVRLKDIQQYCQGSPSRYFIEKLQPAIQDLPRLESNPAD